MKNGFPSLSGEHEVYKRTAIFMNTTITINKNTPTIIMKWYPKNALKKLKTTL